MSFQLTVLDMLHNIKAQPLKKS